MTLEGRGGHMATEVVAPLDGLDWGDIDAVLSRSRQVLQLASDPAVLGGLLAHVAADPHLMTLAERQRWGDKIVLAEHASGARVRLHRWNAGAQELPHSHRWSFAAVILRGRYEHRLYEREDAVLYAGTARCLVTRVEDEGDSYALDAEMVHATLPVTETVSMIIRGPSVKERSLQTSTDTGEHIWKYGAADEPAWARQWVAASVELVEALQDNLSRWGLSR